MRGKRFVYGSYRGRRSTTDVLKTVALILAVLVVLAVAGVWMAQKYIVYDDGGYHLELPFFQKEGPAQEPEDLPGGGRARRLPAGGDTGGGRAPSGGGDCPPFSGGGRLGGGAGRPGRSQQRPAGHEDRPGPAGLRLPAGHGRLGGVNAGQADINRQLQALNSGELYTVARLSCFRDHALAKDETYAIRTNSGYRWTDPEELRWSSPASQAVQDYLVALMVELAQLGFDEILLDNWGYPAEGNLGYIKQGDAYDLEHLSQPVEEFLARAEAALEPYGTRLALRSTWAVLEGEESPAARRPSCWSGMPSGSGWRRRRTVWRTCFPKRGSQKERSGWPCWWKSWTQTWTVPRGSGTRRRELRTRKQARRLSESSDALFFSQRGRSHVAPPSGR